MPLAQNHGFAVPHSHMLNTMGRPVAEQSVAHGGVGFLGVARAGVAPVILEIVDAPVRILKGILIFVALAAGTAGTGFAPASE